MDFCDSLSSAALTPDFIGPSNESMTDPFISLPTLIQETNITLTAGGKRHWASCSQEWIVSGLRCKQLGTCDPGRARSSLDKGSVYVCCMPPASYFALEGTLHRWKNYISQGRNKPRPQSLSCDITFKVIKTVCVCALVCVCMFFFPLLCAYHHTITDGSKLRHTWNEIYSVSIT